MKNVKIMEEIDRLVGELGSNDPSTDEYRAILGRINTLSEVFKTLNDVDVTNREIDLKEKEQTHKNMLETEKINNEKELKNAELDLRKTEIENKNILDTTKVNNEKELKDVELNLRKTEIENKKEQFDSDLNQRAAEHADKMKLSQETHADDVLARRRDQDLKEQEINDRKEISDNELEFKETELEFRKEQFGKEMEFKEVEHKDSVEIEKRRIKKQFGIKIDPNTVLGIAGNLLGILAVLNYEKTDIITSKAFGMIMKGKF